MSSKVPWEEGNHIGGWGSFSSNGHCQHSNLWFMFPYQSQKENAGGDPNKGFKGDSNGGSKGD